MALTCRAEAGRKAWTDNARSLVLAYRMHYHDAMSSTDDRMTLERDIVAAFGPGLGYLSAPDIQICPEMDLRAARARVISDTILHGEDWDDPRGPMPGEADG